MGCISSKPVAKETAGGDKASAGGEVLQASQHAANEDVQLAPETSTASAAAAAAAAAAPHAARGDGVDEGEEAFASLASQPTREHREQREAEAGGPCSSGVATPPVDLDAALRELNGRVQKRCGSVCCAAARAKG